MMEWWLGNCQRNRRPKLRSGRLRLAAARLCMRHSKRASCWRSGNRWALTPITDFSGAPVTPVKLQAAAQKSILPWVQLQPATVPSDNVNRHTPHLCSSLLQQLYALQILSKDTLTLTETNLKLKHVAVANAQQLLDAQKSGRKASLGGAAAPSVPLRFTAPTREGAQKVRHHVGVDLLIAEFSCSAKCSNLTESANI